MSQTSTLVRGPPAQLEIYSPPARGFHWLTVALILMQAPLGLYMAYRGNVLDIWDGLTNALYSTHKLIGLTIFLIVVARLTYRMAHGAPHPEPTIEPWQRAASWFNHWGMYALLIVVPILGYLGISYFPALEIFGLFKLPGLVEPNEETAKVVLFWHGVAAFTLVGLVLIHVSAALFHYFIRRDHVLHRMLPSLLNRGGERR
jgi:cytochrome b561